MADQFDIDGARKAGYSDEEIARFLGKSANFDVDGALKAGYDPADIIQRLHPAALTPLTPLIEGHKPDEVYSPSHRQGGPPVTWAQHQANQDEFQKAYGSQSPWDVIKGVAMSPIRGIMSIPNQVREWFTHPGSQVGQGDPFGEDISPGAYMGDLALMGGAGLGTGAIPGDAGTAVGSFAKNVLPPLLPKVVKAFLPDFSAARQGLQQAGRDVQAARAARIPPIPAEWQDIPTEQPLPSITPPTKPVRPDYSSIPVQRDFPEGIPAPPPRRVQPDYSGIPTEQPLPALPPRPAPPNYSGIPTNVGFPEGIPQPPRRMPPPDYSNIPTRQPLPNVVPPVRPIPPDFSGIPTAQALPNIAPPVRPVPPDYSGIPTAQPLPNIAPPVRPVPPDYSGIPVEQPLPEIPPVPSHPVGEPMKPMSAAEAHRYAHAQATEAELPGSPAGTSKGAHDWLSKQAKVKFGVKSWHELTPAQMQGMGDELLEQNRKIPPVK